MLENDFNDRRGIIKPMRVVTCPGFVDDGYFSTKLLETAFDDSCIFCDRNRVIRVAHDMNQCNPGLGEHGQIVHWIRLAGQRLGLVLETVALD